MKITTKEQIEIIVNELEEIKAESKMRNGETVIQKSKFEVKNILIGYLAALQNRSDWRLTLDDISIKQDFLDDKIIVYADVHHESKIEFVNYNLTYKLGVRIKDSRNFYKEVFISQFLKYLRNTIVFDSIVKNDFD